MPRRPYEEVRQLVAEEGGLMRWTTQKGFFGGVRVIVIDERIGVYAIDRNAHVFPGLEALYVPGTRQLVDDARERLLASLK